MKPIAIAATAALLSMSAAPALATCLTEAAEFAQKICGEVSNRGSKKFVTTSGELNAEAKGLIRQLLGSAGGDFKAETEFSSYENVLQSQLATELVNVRDCGIRMSEAAMNRICSRPTTYKTCRHPDFGQAGWANEEVLNGTSGYRGGGYNQSAYCSDYIAATVSARKLGGTSYNIEILSHSEEARWTGPFNRDREYNYHCQIRLRWGPIYNERTDARCGAAN